MAYNNIAKGRTLSIKLYCRNGDVKPVTVGRDEDLKLIPIADQTAKKVSKEWFTTPLLLLRKKCYGSCFV